jgi:hypothetical protein
MMVPAGFLGVAGFALEDAITVSTEHANMLPCFGILWYVIKEIVQRQ